MMSSATQHSKASKLSARSGFSLLELAIVLVVLATAMGSIAQISTQANRQKRWQQSQNILAEARQSLVAYAMQHGHLPCPASAQATMGLVEQRTGARCLSPRGRLPTTTLGLKQPRSWQILYSVSPEFSDKSARTAGAWPCAEPLVFTSFNLCDRGRHKIYAKPPLVGANLLVNDIVAVVIDLGSAHSPRGTEETENQDDDYIYIHKSPSDDFDDRLAWLTDHTLKYQLAQVGALY